MIPKIIHYCWFGGKPLPSEVRRCIRSWQRVCPDYEIRRWDETNFDVTAHPFMKAAYEAGAWAFVSDIARLMVVHTHGGIYLDTDVELLRRPDGLLDNGCYVGTQQADGLIATGLGFGAEAHDPAVGAMLAEYDSIAFSPEHKAELACPILNTKALAAFGYTFLDEPQQLSRLLVLPPRFLDPYAPGDGTRELLCADTLSIHHYSASWLGPRARFRRRLIRLIGPARANKLKRMLRHG